MGGYKRCALQALERCWLLWRTPVVQVVSSQIGVKTAVLCRNRTSIWFLPRSHWCTSERMFSLLKKFAEEQGLDVAAPVGTSRLVRCSPAAARQHWR